MTQQFFDKCMEQHAIWRAKRVEGARADFSNKCLHDINMQGYCMAGARIEGADFSGAIINWDDHHVIAELLRQAAGGRIDRINKIKDIRFGCNQASCWDDYITGFDANFVTWAQGILRNYVKAGDNAHEFIT